MVISPKFQRYEDIAMGNSLEEHFRNLNDPRKSTWLQLHELRDILIIAICATIGGADSFEDIAAFGRAKLDWFKKFLNLRNGIPSHDTFNRVFERLDSKNFKDCFLSWVNAICKLTVGEIVAIDGKTIRGSRSSSEKPLHIVSAWANENQMVLGQLATDEKSNEITAIPKLLEMLELKGCIVTIDAMGCQKEIAKKITEKEADYVLGLKGNQGTMHDDVKMQFEGAAEAMLTQKTADYFEDVSGDHGRIETRKYWITSDIDWLSNKDAWQGLKSVGIVQSTREVGDKVSTERRYFLTSLDADAKLFAKAVRGHWGVENSLHWSLDVTFKEDACKVKGNAAQNLSHLRHIALNLLKSDTSKGSIRGKRLKAGWDNDFLGKILKTQIL